jgi:hypothetical protein
LEREEAIREIFKRLRQEGLAARRLGSHIRETIESSFLAAVRRCVIYRNRSTYRQDCRSIAHYSRDHLIKYLLAAIGHTWHTRDEATTAAARYLGFRRTGRNIQAAFRSAINAGIRRNLLDRDGPDYIRRT